MIHNLPELWHPSNECERHEIPGFFRQTVVEDEAVRGLWPKGHRHVERQVGVWHAIENHERGRGLNSKSDYEFNIIWGHTLNAPGRRGGTQMGAE